MPEELARREKRLAEIARAKVMKARAKERHARERAEYGAKMAALDAKAAQTGKKPCGRAPQTPVEGPLSTDQVNLTDEESRIMPVADGGFEQCYNGPGSGGGGQPAGGGRRCSAGADRVYERHGGKPAMAAPERHLRDVPDYDRISGLRESGCSVCRSGEIGRRARCGTTAGDRNNFQNTAMIHRLAGRSIR